MDKYKLTDFYEGALVTGVNGQITWFILGADGVTPIKESWGHNSRSEALKEARKWRRENFDLIVRLYEKRRMKAL